MKDEIGRTVDGNKPVRLPDEAGTQGFAILATRGAGKSATAGVMEELMCQRGIPFAVLDPAGAHWGINFLENNGRPGRSSGLDVLVVGGKYGQVPLDEHAGGALAEILVETDINCIVDLKVAHYAARKRFIADFANRLFELNETPRHIFLEEAHEFVPQQLRYDEQKNVFAALERLIKGGRGQGLGFSLISQRPQEVAKAVLELIDNLILMRTRGPRSIAAAKEWIETNLADREQIADILATMPRLPDGEAWLVSPFWLEEVTRFRVRLRETYHAGRTPKAGEKPVKPKRVELGKVIEQFRDAATKLQLAVEEQKDLRTQLKDANAEMAKLRAAKPIEVADPTAIDRAVAAAVESERAITETLRAEWLRRQKAITDLVASAVTAGDGLHQASEAMTGALARLTEGLRVDILPALPPVKAAVAATTAASRTVTPFASPSPRPSVTTAPNGNGPVGTADGLKAGARRMLEELARRYPLHWTRAQMAQLTGYKMKGGTFKQYVGELRRRGLITVEGKDYKITEDGLAAVDVIPSSPQTHAEAMAFWRKALKAGAFRILEEIVSVGSAGITREEVAGRLGYEVHGGTFKQYTGLLKRNGLIDLDGSAYHATALLFPDG